MATKVDVKEEIRKRGIRIALVLGIIAIAIFAKIIYLQTTKKEELLKMVEKIQQQKRTIYATRGNIYASDGISLLATSIPRYQVVFNPLQAKKELFELNIDSTCILLASFFKDKNYLEYKEEINKARKNESKYLILGNRKINHEERLYFEKFPLFREGQYKGGGYFEKEEYRFFPFNNLAMRTIGKLDRENNRLGSFGIEASFENYLKGKDGQGFYERLAGGVLKPVNLASDISSEPGLDVVTTLDINFQDIVESALKKQVIKMQAKYGSAVVMEIATGEIKAIANLTRKTDAQDQVSYIEEINYAVKEGTDPGSTFKLASMAAIIEKSGANPDDFGVDCSGEIKHNGVSFTCAHEHGKLTIQQIFEKSCNIGIYQLMKTHFGFNNPEEYFAYLRKFKLDKPSGFQLKGEPHPYIKNSQSSTFSSTTIPWMSIGYESRITPIQMLTFYNAVANDGYWVQPLIVKEIRDKTKVFEQFEANKPETPICSPKTSKKIKKMMEGVVLNGTAKNINTGNCPKAGKTGTSQKRTPDGYKKGLYYTSFIGYFPANKPKYSCVVVIDEPVGTNIYASDVSAPVFNDISEKIYAYDIGMHRRLVIQSNKQKLANHYNAGKVEDQNNIAQKLGLELNIESKGFVKPTVIKTDSIAWQTQSLDKNIEGILGLSLKDVLPILENKGYKVKFEGSGKVKSYQLVNKKFVALTLR